MLLAQLLHQLQVHPRDQPVGRMLEQFLRVCWGASALIRPVPKSRPVMRVCRLFKLSTKLVRFCTRPIRRRNKSRTGRTARSQIFPVGRMFQTQQLGQKKTVRLVVGVLDPVGTAASPPDWPGRRDTRGHCKPSTSQYQL